MNIFGPYLCNAGNQNETLEDPNNSSCTTSYTIIAPASCAAPTCPTYDVEIVGIYEDDGCAMYAIVSVTGFSSSEDVSFVSFQFDISGATITGIDVANSGDPIGSDLNFSTNGSSATVSFFDENSPIQGDDLNDYVPLQKFRIDITGDPGDCFTLQVDDDSGIQVINTDNDITVSCDPQGDFTIENACIPSTTVSGKVTGFSQTWTPCDGTQNLAIIGAEVSITGDNGSCLDDTDINGDYSCELCPSEDYEICVETECDEPCGLTDLDVVLLRDYILGNRTPPGPEFFFIGDVNGDGVVSTADNGCLQQYLVHGTTSCTDNWCRFVPVEEFNQLSGTFQISMTVDNCITFTENEIVNQLVSTDFIRFNVGDFNGSCDDCVHGEGGPYLIEGESPVAILNRDNAWQISFDQDHDLLAFTSKIQLGIGITDEIVEINSALPGLTYNIENGILHIMWVEMNDGKDLFTANAKEPFITFTIDGNNEVDANLISEDNYILDIEKGIFKIFENNAKSEIRSSKTNKQSLRLNHYALQNIPVTSEDVRVQLFDMSGRTVLADEFLLNDGMNHLRMNTTLLTTGIYVARYVTDQCIFSQKIFVE